MDFPQKRFFYSEVIFKLMFKKSIQLFENKNVEIDQYWVVKYG